MLPLRLDDIRQPQGTREDERAHHDEAEGDLVAYHLRRGPQRAEDAVFIARGPAAQDDAVLAEGGKGKDVEQAYIDVPDDQLDGPPENVDRAAEGDDREQGEGGKQGDHGREDEEGLVRIRRDDIFLRERLYAVGYGLEEPVRTDPVRPEPDLEPAQHLSLRQGQVGNEEHEDRDDDDGLHQGFYGKE